MDFSIVKTSIAFNNNEISNLAQYFKSIKYKSLAKSYIKAYWFEIKVFVFPLFCFHLNKYFGKILCVK